MSLQTPTIIRVLQRKLCREAKKESTPHRLRLRSVICFVCLRTKPVGEPDAGNPHVRFDERGWETERRRMAQATAPILDSTFSSNRCNAPIRELSEVQRTCRERWKRVDLTKMTHKRHWMCTAAMVLLPISAPI